MSAPDPKSSAKEHGSVLVFSLGSIVMTFGLALLAANAPPRIRLLGLFPVAIGLLTGGLLNWLARTLQVELDAPKLVFIGLLTFFELIVTLCQTVALQPVKPSKISLHPIAAMVEARLPEASEPPTAEPPTAPRFLNRLLAYLHGRLKGDWSSPWPELFWLTETVIGTTASVWIALGFRHRKVAP